VRACRGVTGIVCRRRSTSWLRGPVAQLDDEVVELSAWDVLRVAPAVIRSFEAGPEGLDVICIGGRKPKGGDSERFEDFWN
ncbi:MAG TPA: hypothetical protein VG499_03095, partial [Actinomycetota bacterium]|nr:hypothetical protein [Actinomycetota bacterium]